MVYAIHWDNGNPVLKMLGEAGVVAACGYWNANPRLWTPDRWSADRRRVTCALCKRTRAWKEAEAPLTMES